MSNFFQNSCIRDAASGGGHSTYVDIIDALGDGYQDAILEIEQFSGTKVFISCTPQIPLVSVLKRALCFADLVILSPAPGWFSCDPQSPFGYREFNLDMFGSGIPLGRPGPWCPIPILRKIAQLFPANRRDAVYGAVTFLPFISQDGHRWSSEALGIAELPRPYLSTSRAGRTCSASDIHAEALLAICQERLVAERLGAAHLNALSFTTPIMNDLETAQIGRDSWAHSLVRIEFPLLHRLPLRELLSLRADMPDTFASFSGAIIRDSRAAQIANSGSTELGAKIAAAAAALDCELRAAAARSRYLSARLAVKTATFVLCTGGSLGQFSSTIAFLGGGGAAWDFVELVRDYRAAKLKARKDSMYFGVEIMRRARRAQERRHLTLL